MLQQDQLLRCRLAAVILQVAHRPDADSLQHLFRDLTQAVQDAHRQRLEELDLRVASASVRRAEDGVPRQD